MKETSNLYLKFWMLRMWQAICNHLELGETSMLETCNVWTAVPNINSFPKASFGNSIVSNAKYALTGSSILELWRSMFTASMPEYLNYSQRQVLVFQIILYVNFALKLSDLVWKWRTIFETWTILKGKIWKFIQMWSMQ